MSEDSELEAKQEAEAKEAGWAPKEEWRGLPEKWVDAKTFVERNEHIMPLLKRDRDRLKVELATRDARIAEMTRAIQEGRASMEAFKEFAEADTKRRVEAAREDLKRQLKAAREAGDVDAEVEVQDAMVKLSAETAAPKKTIGEARQEQQQMPITPVFREWITENPWYSIPSLGQQGDEEKTAYAHGVAVGLAKKGLLGRELLDAITKKVQGEYPDTNPRREAPGKVEGSRTGAHQSSSGRHSLSELSREDREAFERYADKMVGPNKMYKTKAEYEKSYLARVFEESA